MSNPKLIEALRLLVSEYYIVLIDGIPTITGKLERELLTVIPTELYEVPKIEPEASLLPEVIIKEVKREVIPLHSKSKQVILTPGVQQPLAEFIMVCGVPQKIKMDNGNSFWANKYSKEADLELRKILAEGYQLDILVAATKLYYKTGSCCKAVSNYILHGDWLTGYMEMEKSLATGTTHEHITETLNNSEGKPTYQTR